MRKWMALLWLLSVLQLPVAATDFETATEAVANMKVGWNLGNTLDSNSGDVENMWIELWTSRKPTDYEKAWGQPVTTRQLIHMFKEAGFNAIRVPVTWYPHMGTVKVTNINNSGHWDMSTWTGYDVNAAWMARVKEVVDYVIDEGMYCILNVHHDTGASTTAWLEASGAGYNKAKERFESLWTQIAMEFKDYGEHLLFEGYNEMLDGYDSWCFASFAAPGNYNKASATDTYEAINNYAQSFVNAVRATGGNNAQRNLVVCTYGACCGEGSWNTHLVDPLKEMKLPSDNVSGHIIFEVHSYPNVSNLNNVKKSIDDMIKKLETNLVSKGAPVIFGEWGTSDGNDYTNYHSNTLAFAEYFSRKATEAGMGTFYWMGLADQDDRAVPKWTRADLKDAIIKGYNAGVETAVRSAYRTTEKGNNTLYNLQGQRIQEPQPGQLYIRNGKKYRK